MSTQGPEKSEDKINILLGRIKDAETEFGISLKNYNRLTNPRLKAMAEDRMNMLLTSIIRYAVEGIPKEYIGSYPDWINNNQEKIQGWLQTEGISQSTITEVNELINSKPAPSPRTHAAPPPRPDTRPRADSFRTHQQAREQAARGAAENRDRERAEQDERPEVVAERKLAFDTVMKDPEQILKDYKSILGASRVTAKFSAKGKSSREDIENIVKLFKKLQNEHETDWQESAKAAYCYVKSIFDKYDVKFYGMGYEIKHQNPVADACYNYMTQLGRSVTKDYINIDLLFQGGKARDYVRSCEEKIQAFDRENRNAPKKR